jgi:vacuolar-type H+-ATPase subunit H
MVKLLKPSSAATSSLKDELAKLKAVAISVQQIRVSAQRELELARQIRAQAQRYQQETETKARSQAQQLILGTRLATRREVEELVRKASAEIQKILADMRVIRITAQEELAAQKKFTDAARLCSLSLALQGETGAPNGKKKQPLACTQ